MEKRMKWEYKGGRERKIRKHAEWVNEWENDSERVREEELLQIFQQMLQVIFVNVRIELCGDSSD